MLKAIYEACTDNIYRNVVGLLVCGKIFTLLSVPFLSATFPFLAEPQIDTDKSAFLIICDTAPHKIIVLDDTGKWMHRVRETEIKIDSNSTLMKCVMFEGHYRPSSPESKNWKLAQIKTVSETEFQTMINELQSDPDVVRKKLSEKPSSN